MADRSVLQLPASLIKADQIHLWEESGRTVNVNSDGYWDDFNDWLGPGPYAYHGEEHEGFERHGFDRDRGFENHEGFGGQISAKAPTIISTIECCRANAGWLLLFDVSFSPSGEIGDRREKRAEPQSRTVSARGRLVPPPAVAFRARISFRTGKRRKTVCERLRPLAPINRAIEKEQQKAGKDIMLKETI